MIRLLSLVLLVCLGLAGCAGQPTPFQTGAEVAPPWGCIDLRARGGRC